MGIYHQLRTVSLRFGSDSSLNTFQYAFSYAESL